MITVNDSLLTQPLVDACRIWLNNARWSYGWKSHTDKPYGHWNVDITKTDKNNPTDVSDRLAPPFAAVWAELNKALFNNEAKVTRCYSNRHTYGTEGYIHTDTEREGDLTCVVYMNEQWDADWGGETTFYSPDKSMIINAILPKYGRVVIFPGTIHHCARALTRICPEVRTTLMFKITIDPAMLYSSEAKLSNFLTMIGANNKPHKNGSLKDHLLRTYHILKSNGLADVVALAGGLHSVYGTNVFKNGCLSENDTQINDLFGEEVDRFVRLFSTIDRPNCLETPDGSLSDSTLFVLRCIECANLYDQGELTELNYPNLYKFTETLKKR
jgi:SM-20-related protein